MATVRNISTGPRGAYRKGVLVTVDPGKTADADDWNEEWFAPADGTVDESDLGGLDLAGLVRVAVAEGVLESEEVLLDDLRRAITGKREFEAARAAAGNDRNSLDHDGDGNPGGMADDALEDASADDIVSAIGLLDGTNDEHWTTAGLPAVAAVQEIAGKTVTRAAISAAAPDAKRPETEA